MLSLAQIRRRTTRRAGLFRRLSDLLAVNRSRARLAVLGTQFSQNLLADERDWFMPLSEADLAGLPDFVIAAARAAGTEKAQSGPVVTLSRSLIVPFLSFSARRDLREQAWRAWVGRGDDTGSTDNRAICRDILALRAERQQADAGQGLEGESFAHRCLLGG